LFCETLLAVFKLFAVLAGSDLASDFLPTSLPAIKLQGNTQPVKHLCEWNCGQFREQALMGIFMTDKMLIETGYQNTKYRRAKTHKH